MNNRHAGAPSQRQNKYRNYISHFLLLRCTTAYEQDTEKLLLKWFIYIGYAKTAKGDAQTQGLLQMAIGERARRVVSIAPRRIAQKGGIRHRRRSARNHGNK
jgi:hypothetical protein